MKLAEVQQTGSTSTPHFKLHCGSMAGMEVHLEIFNRHPNSANAFRRSIDRQRPEGRDRRKGGCVQCVVKLSRNTTQQHSRPTSGAEQTKESRTGQKKEKEIGGRFIFTPTPVRRIEMSIGLI
jgi:hypothetical protein